MTRIKNVRDTALSGDLSPMFPDEGGNLTGSAHQEPTTAPVDPTPAQEPTVEPAGPDSGPQDDPPLDIPPDLTTVDALLDWVAEPDDADEAAARGRAVLAAEYVRDEDDQRSTLINPLAAAYGPEATEGQ